EALDSRGGHGAVRLLAHDPDRRALLLARCRPGTPPGTRYGEGQIAVAATLVQRLWRSAPPEVPWRRREDVAARWQRALPRRYEGLLVEAALDALEALLGTQDELVLCHQDLHGGNILR